jgi:hypothetical protein
MLLKEYGVPELLDKVDTTLVTDLCINLLTNKEYRDKK